ncbi:hypothetical protein N9W69_04600 [Flavobacteriaceae bacterium]|jgi:uncharacterized integral membrane protein|nr:hypothetical protein [Flavobacteriaceae bacterium]
MKYFRYVLISIAIILIVYNATILDFNALLQGDSQIALIGILASASVIVLLLILIQAERVKQRHKDR